MKFLQQSGQNLWIHTWLGKMQVPVAEKPVSLTLGYPASREVPQNAEWFAFNFFHHLYVDVAMLICSFVFLAYAWTNEKLKDQKI